MLHVNLDGAFLCLREAARVLVSQGQGGSLVGVSSTSAIDGAPGQQHYAASKTALLAVMRGLAVELARHMVRCNSLLPGWTDTELLAGAKTHEKFVTATIQRTPVRWWATLHDFETVGAFLGDPSLVFHTGDSMGFCLASGVSCVGFSRPGAPFADEVRAGAGRLRAAGPLRVRLLRAFGRSTGGGS